MDELGDEGHALRPVDVEYSVQTSVAVCRRTPAAGRACVVGICRSVDVDGRPLTGARRPRRRHRVLDVHRQRLVVERVRRRSVEARRHLRWRSEYQW